MGDGRGGFLFENRCAILGRGGLVCLAITYARRCNHGISGKRYTDVKIAKVGA